MSKRNRQRPPQEQVESAILNHQLPMTDSTRPDESISTPEPVGIVERNGTEMREVEWRPAYPCPHCSGQYGGIGIVQRTMSVIVYCKCNRCAHTWSAPKRIDAVPVNSIMVCAAIKTE